jgi:hypothetical protein
LVDNKGNIVEVLGFVKLASKYSISCFMPDKVKPGQYSLRIVTRPTGGEWSIVELYNRDKKVPKSFNITVLEETGVKGGGYGLSLRRFNIYPDADKTTVSPNEEFTVDHSLSDVSSTTFPAVTSGVALIDKNNNLVEILGTLDIPSNANSNMAVGKKIKCKVPSTVAPGQYKLRIVVKTEGKTEWRAVTQIDGNLPTFIDFTVI